MIHLVPPRNLLLPPDWGSGDLSLELTRDAGDAGTPCRDPRCDPRSGAEPAREDSTARRLVKDESRAPGPDTQRRFERQSCSSATSLPVIRSTAMWMTQPSGAFGSGKATSGPM